MAVMKISGYDVLVDDEDVERLSQYKWSVQHGSRRGSPYFRMHIRVNGERKTMQLHRFLMGCMPNDGTFVDHINRDTFDNRKNNLRMCTIEENNRNRKKPSVWDTPYKGVRYSTGENRWGAIVAYNGCNIRVGTYATPEEAAREYDRVAIRLHGDFACTNFDVTQYTAEEIENSYQKAISILSCNNTSGYRGVCRHKANGTWIAHICYMRNSIYIGSFSSSEGAARAYDRKALELLGDNAKLNFPKEDYIKELAE